MILLPLLLLCACLASAAVFAPEGILVERQDASSTSSQFTYSTLGYSYAYESEGTTIWAPDTYDPESYFITSSGSYFKACSYTSDYSYITLGSTYSYQYSTWAETCPMYTSCSLGVLVASSTTYQCAGDGYMCGTLYLYDRYGESSGLTDYACFASSSPNATSIVSLYKERPDGVVSPVTTTASSPSNTLAPGSSPTNPTPSSTSPSTPGSSKSNNAGVIAGSVVGGLAVLALAGVATLWILKRNRRQAPYGPESAAGPAHYGHYQPEKVQDVPEYNPHASANYSGATAGGSPHMGMHSPVPVYADGFPRGELSGIRSPVQ